MTRFPTAPAFLITLLFAGGVAGCSTADLRTKALKDEDLTAARAERGQALLQEVAERQGLATWRAHSTLRVEAVDHWAWGWFSQEWWPANPQRFRADMLLGTFTSRVELLNGPEEGSVWGIQHWDAYTKSSRGAPVRRRDAEAIIFYLPTLHYFMELPFRLLRADVAAYAGQRTLGGRTYDLVLVTWEQLAPSDTHDQYLLWIDRETKRLAMCRYTLRDAADWAAGTIFFDDYRTVDGVALPFRQTVTLSAPGEADRPVDENYFHQVVVDTAAFDVVSEASLVIDSLRTPADSKPPGFDSMDLF